MCVNGLGSLSCMFTNDVSEQMLPHLGFRDCRLKWALFGCTANVFNLTRFFVYFTCVLRHFKVLDRFYSRSFLKKKSYCFKLEHSNQKPLFILLACSPIYTFSACALPEINFRQKHILLNQLTRTFVIFLSYYKHDEVWTCVERISRHCFATEQMFICVNSRIEGMWCSRVGAFGCSCEFLILCDLRTSIHFYWNCFQHFLLLAVHTNSISRGVLFCAQTRSAVYGLLAHFDTNSRPLE